MIRRITLEGKISIGLCLFWAISILGLLRRGPLSDHCELFAVYMTLPLGAIDNIGSIFARRGVMSLGEVMTAYLLMIPNVLLLGYGLASFYRLFRIILRRSLASDVNPVPPSKTDSPNKAHPTAGNAPV
ncbi:MAG: hypothetical protein ACRDBP_16400 [Luteolibacter sp.]